ncbi:Membrane protein involved in the export of O-antigen and teichoic acid [Xylanibacter ruminicola]|uniref:Membrane protein involved in the export of O-antigen and teichoic acid n=1 Tax=Xylanibacter ruminicola TaxID=839 RepID=A0A1H4ES96_XYLRU|nr:oligosaccharide flippase family protein [Xylanibacter ruminicola]SEA87816.1 Membrane protein involved in the export of O-antigen and teichoic acid [Xylanibacter ruminicola]
MLKELFKGSAIYGVAPFVPKILTVLLLPILTLYLTSTDYGIIGTITSVVFAVQALQDLGLRSLLPNYFYKCQSQYKLMWREVYGFLSIWMIFFAIVQAVLLYFFIPKEAEDNRWLIIILGNFSSVFFGPTATIGQLYYQLNLKPTPVAWRIVMSGVITIIVNFVCVVVFRWGYMGAYVGGFAGTFLTNLTYWPAVNRHLGLSPIYNFKWRTIIRLLKVSIPTIPHYYSAYLMNSSNVLAMNYHHKPQTEIGHLTMSQSIFSMFDTVMGAISQVWSPMSYQFIHDKNTSEMKRILYVYIMMAYTLTFLYSLWSREIYDILISNDEIAATYKYSIILVMALNYRPLYVYCIDYFFYHEHTVQMLGITFMAGIISFVFYFTMIPYMGIYAALIGFYLGCLYMGYCGYFYPFYHRMSIYDVKWYLFLLLQLLMTVLAFYLVDYSIIFKILISTVFLSVIGYLFLSRVKSYAIKIY